MLPPDPDTTGSSGGSLMASTTSPPVVEDVDRGVVPTSQERHGWRRLVHQRWVWASAIFMFVVGAAIAASFVVRVPYYAFSPGSLYETQALVSVDGVDTFPSDGDVMLTTISVSRRRLTAWEAMVGWLDPTVSVFEERTVIGDQDRETVQQFNLQMMTGSQDVSTYVALRELGYDVGVTGTGVFVVQVVEDSAADGVLVPGDTIVAVDGQSVQVSTELIDAIGDRAPGDTVELRVEHLGDPVSEVVEVTLGAREDDPDAPLLGVELQTRDGSFVYPDGVDVVFVDSGIGGPSAGLAFTLTIIDEMTPGEITGGATIAVTGEIRADGSIGPIGGIEQKAVTVRRAGVDVFLVPAGLPDNEMAAARRQAGDAVEIIDVATLDEALDVLESLGGAPIEEIAPAA